MLNRSLPAVVLAGALAFVGPALAQSANNDADDEAPIVSTPADSAAISSSTRSERVTRAEDGTVVVTRRQTHSRVVRVSRSGGAGPNGVSKVAGTIGGAIGGRDILGTTPADNALLPPRASTP